MLAARLTSSAPRCSLTQRRLSSGQHICTLSHQPELPALAIFVLFWNVALSRLARTDLTGPAKCSLRLLVSCWLIYDMQGVHYS
jgi:hypothetical protein